jgi:hypothetical protein
MTLFGLYMEEKFCHPFLGPNSYVMPAHGGEMVVFKNI